MSDGGIVPEGVPEAASVPNLVTSLSNKLRDGSYECPVCIDPIVHDQPRWSCSVCFGLGHLPCIVFWAQTQIEQAAAAIRNGSSVPAAAPGGLAHNEGFRCPLCQNINRIETTAEGYYCFCRKTAEPKYDPLLVPGSCGQECGRRLGKPKRAKAADGTTEIEYLCNHTCSMQCHPGPCPECPKSRLQECYCGASEKVVGCGSDIFGYECGEVCGRELNCGKHFCANPCHSGPCAPCEKIEVLPCFCGAQTEARVCSTAKGYTCGGRCPKKLSCGVHSCDRRCHDGPCPECERSPKKVHRCPCTKTPLWQLHSMNADLPARTSCIDPIPTCDQVCGAPLGCLEHYCQRTCHDDHPGVVSDAGASAPPTDVPVALLKKVAEFTKCPPCLELVTIRCRCGSLPKKQQLCFFQYIPKELWKPIMDVVIKVGLGPESDPAAKGSMWGRIYVPTAKEKDKLTKGFLRDFPFVCEKYCNKPLSCGKHQCEEICCPHARSDDYEVAMYGGGAAASASGGGAHVCMKICKKKASCGIHTCGQLCHSGPCPPCQEFATSPLYCRCRKSVIDPPVPCGTKAPKCNHPCSVPRPCGHPANHACHPDQPAAAAMSTGPTSSAAASSSTMLHQTLPTRDPSDPTVVAGCPPCVFPVEKRCPSHNTVLPYFQACYLGNTISCGKKCNKMLGCCGVRCQHTCHPGDCKHLCLNKNPTLDSVVGGRRK